MTTITLDIPLNRVEGDLDIQVTLEDQTIIDAKSIGTLYRGFENMLVDRVPMDALVITPRICGICSITHLTAAVKAIESASGIIPPPQAVRMRNLSILAETVQSDLRQVFLMFMGDFAHAFYQDAPFFQEATEYYAPLKGKGSTEALVASKDILKVIAIIGGQWPHTSHMVPGGICTIPTIIDMTLVETHIDNCIAWYQRAVLGDSLRAFEETVTSYDTLQQWIQTHPDTHLARFVTYCQQAGLEQFGQSYDRYLSYGAVDQPDHPSEQFIRSGTYQQGAYQPLDPSLISEDISHGWFKQTRIQQPPFEGETQPDAQHSEGYSWSKAPRYQQQPMQTGPLAQALVDGEPLMTDLVKLQQDSVFVRELARLLRPARHLKWLKQQVTEVLQNFGDSCYHPSSEILSGQGMGLTEAARGALGHWIELQNNQIKRYQIITPTAWNGSPQDQQEQPGPWEKALLGLKVKDINHPMEMGHVIRSFDPCLVCTVHAIGDLPQPQTFRFNAF